MPYSKGTKACIAHAVQENRYEAVNVTRTQARSYLDNMSEGTLADQLMEAVDAAQGKADQPGKATYIVIRIEGEEI